MGFIVGVTFLTFSFILVIMAISFFLQEAEDKTAESLCESANALATQVTFKNPVQDTRLAPRACKTIHKEYPEEGYPQTVEGVKENMLADGAKCWKMWLEAKYPEILGGRGAFRSDEQARCHDCYTFSIKKNIKESITGIEFQESLDKSGYIAKDQSDKCRLTDLGYGGGKCMKECGGKFPKKVTSDKCNEEGKTECCIAPENECLNKGGKCSPACEYEEVAYNPPNGWKCSEKEEACCVKEDNYYTYRDYFQRFGGQGEAYVEDGIIFKTGEVYAISYVSDISADVWRASFARREQGPEIAKILYTRLDFTELYCKVQTA